MFEVVKTSFCTTLVCKVHIIGIFKWKPLKLDESITSNLFLIEIFMCVGLVKFAINDNVRNVAIVTRI